MCQLDSWLIDTDTAKPQSSTKISPSFDQSVILDVPGYEPSTTVPSQDVSLADVCQLFPNCLHTEQINGFIQAGLTANDILSLLPMRFPKKRLAQMISGTGDEDAAQVEAKTDERELWIKQLMAFRAKELRAQGLYKTLMKSEKLRPDGRDKDCSFGPVNRVPGVRSVTALVPDKLSLVEICEQYPLSIDGELLKDFVRRQWTSDTIFEYWP